MVPHTSEHKTVMSFIVTGATHGYREGEKRQETISWRSASWRSAPLIRSNSLAMQIRRCGNGRHSFMLRNRAAFAITLTEDSAIAAAAMIGDSRMPKNGYSAPAATGTPTAL